MTITDPILSAVEERFTCLCNRTELRYRLNTKGGKMWARQCLDCGAPSKWIKAETLAFSERYHAKEIDEAIRSKWWEARNEFGRELREQRARQEREEFFAEYDIYLRSERWRRKRAKVLERDEGLCQACRQRPATEVHHLTYERVYHEPLFDLVSVCSPCHEFLTSHARAKRG